MTFRHVLLAFVAASQIASAASNLDNPAIDAQAYVRLVGEAAASTTRCMCAAR